MAQKVTTEFIDDIDGSVAERTFTFSVDGTDYAIDLSTDNINEFKSAIGGFIESARKVKATSNGRKTRAAKPGSNREHLQAVREWLRTKGYDVKDKGRISADLMARFDAAHPAGQQPAPEAPVQAPQYTVSAGWH